MNAPRTTSSARVSDRRRSTTRWPPVRSIARSASSSARRARRSRPASSRPCSAGSTLCPPIASRRALSSSRSRRWALFLTGQMAAAKRCADSHPIVPGSAGPAEGRLYALRALLASFFPGEAGAADLARAGLALLGEDDPVRALTLFALGTARLAQGDWHGAIETLRPALEAARRTGQSMTAAASATMLGAGSGRDRRPTRGRSPESRGDRRFGRIREPGGAGHSGSWCIGCSASSATRRATSSRPGSSSSVASRR